MYGVFTYHLGDFYVKCRWKYNTWILWGMWFWPMIFRWVSWERLRVVMCYVVAFFTRTLFTLEICFTSWCKVTTVSIPWLTVFSFFTVFIDIRIYLYTQYISMFICVYAMDIVSYIYIYMYNVRICFGFGPSQHQQVYWNPLLKM